MAHNSALRYSPTELKILIHNNLYIKALFETDQKIKKMEISQMANR